MGRESYERAGVKGQAGALSLVELLLSPTFSFPKGADVISRFGQYASVLKISDDLAIALCTDGVGSKTLIAAALDRYDTIGFDCVAMNVNDIVCVGARPLAMVDYLAVHALDDVRTAGILKGLGAAAEQAEIAIPGGEVAQLPELIGSRPGTSQQAHPHGAHGDEKAFDLVGACVGVLRPDELIVGQAVSPGDAIIGIRSSGIHSNGLTLARRVLLDAAGYRLDDDIPALGRRLGEELLEATKIYVRAVTSLWDAGIDTRGLVHVTGDGLANLCRLEARVGYLIDELPPPPAVFELIQRAGEIADSEMLRVFNMGIGFIALVPATQAHTAVETIEAQGYRAQRIGVATDEVGCVRIEPLGLVGSLQGGESRFAPG